jgi:undecaprenyl-diphosphatase
MDFLQAVILSVVEGLTEFLPVSSTGHLILAADLLGVPDSEFLKTFEIAIQVGAILSVVVLYGRTLLTSPAILKRVVVAFVPTALFGLIFYKLVKTLLGSETVVVWTFFLGGIFLILFERFHRERADAVEDLRTLPYATAVKLGLFQVLALVPGVSRSGATIVGGLLLGLKRRTIVEFSFLLAVPTIGAAAGWDLLKHGGSFSLGEIDLLLVSGLFSFVVALLAIKFFVRFVQSHTFVPFGIYRILAAVIFFIWML